MSRVIDEDKLYSKSTVQYLHERGLDYKIQENYRKFGKGDPHANSGGDIPIEKILAEADVESPDPPSNPTFVDGSQIVVDTVVPEPDNSETSQQTPPDDFKYDIEHLHPHNGEYSLDEFDEGLRDQVSELNVKECQENLKDLKAGPRTGTLEELRWRVAKAVVLTESGS